MCKGMSFLATFSFAFEVKGEAERIFPELV